MRSGRSSTSATRSGTVASGSTSTTSWAKVSGEPRLVTPPARTGDSPTSSIGVRPVKLTPAQRDQIAVDAAARYRAGESRSEEHTSELQSRGHLVCRLLLEKIIR